MAGWRRQAADWDRAKARSWVGGHRKARSLGKTPKGYHYPRNSGTPALIWVRTSYSPRPTFCCPLFCLTFYHLVNKVVQLVKQRTASIGCRYIEDDRQSIRVGP